MAPFSGLSETVVVADSYLISPLFFSPFQSISAFEDSVSDDSILKTFALVLHLNVLSD